MIESNKYPIAVQGKPYSIVCVKPYEFEGKQFNIGDISMHSWGRNIPNGWRKATQKEIDNYRGNK